MVAIDEVLKRVKGECLCIMEEYNYMKSFCFGKKQQTITFSIPKEVADFQKYHYTLLAIEKNDWNRAYDEAKAVIKKEGE